jgi:hypothetical protein
METANLAASLPARSAESWGMPFVRQIKHEAIPGCGSFEVRFEDGRPSTARLPRSAGTGHCSS